MATAGSLVSADSPGRVTRGPVPPDRARCVEAFLAAIFLEHSSASCRGLFLFWFCLIRRLPRTNPMANRSSGSCPNASNSWRSGARVAEETKPRQAVQPRLCKRCAFPLGWTGACPARMWENIG